jgi:hypothetical protein
MLCDIRDRLTAEYNAAVAKVSEDGRRFVDSTTQAWREATHGSRIDSLDAMKVLNEHRREHGC